VYSQLKETIICALNQTRKKTLFSGNSSTYKPLGSIMPSSKLPADGTEAPQSPSLKPVLSHLDEHGKARMVSIQEKPVSQRIAVAVGQITMAPETLQCVMDGTTPKGDVFAVARIAGIQAAKRTSDLIPLCHPISLVGIDITLSPNRERSSIEVQATVRALDRTGVEMEALTAVSVACLTLYDMLKAIDKTMEIGGIVLNSKQGGRSGDFQR
jgi:cyclic pyranopterin monophosphate synthase